MTTPETNRILVVDDEPFIRKLAERELALPGREVTTAATAAQALRLAKRNGFDVVLLDVRLPDGNGNRLLEHFRETLPDVEVIMITGYSEVDSAVEAMKAGAYDYVTKPFSLDRMNLLIDRAYQRRVMQRELRRLRMNKGGKPRSRLIGTSAPMRQIGFLVDKVAPTDAPVLITGESGVGKNVVVNVLHSRSSRAEMPLIVKNCGAFNKELLRSELFGYCKGAFTGAETSQEGVLAQADKGTLFFDEVGELPLEVQAMLLRVFESQTYRRVGDREERSVDVRFLFATNRDLAREVEEGRFHEALYHRLNVFRIDIPPLRERKEDIPQLIEHFLENLYPDRPPYRLSKRAGQSMITYDWPGNVRELRNVIERGIILAENDLITTKCLPSDIADSLEQGEPLAALPTLEQQEKRYILRVMEHVDQNRTQAARILGIGRKTLYRKLRSFGDS
ncbi:sigma-54-dependent transcriptional regulator [Pseudodesulfovibrio indicus]|uniref:Two-component system NtrC family response regulator n=1 Tax=Pseudodesulfovibrio indicus TaxID=1716143 RepID=A0A126QIY8_9BACT|nr:sigma-54 dependent transcriptional regulator [Pseudodesulfovibrio indicus]AMK09941.1 two-component system response regulator [Pseudodesulfovibrio indicus]TDT87377.1 two-component system NtrC family response regulator [Pseudodesulfovibrio indicus]